MYSKSYIYAFGKDRSFFYENDLSTIYSFLRENYWGDSLTLRTKLLVTLLFNDAQLQPAKIKKEFLRKSKELNEYYKQLP